MKRYLLLAFILSTITICKAQKTEFWAVSSQGSGPLKGTIFKIAGDTDTVEYYFNGTPDGNGPVGSLIQANNGLLYGMTAIGGANNLGTIFSYDISTGVETALFSFGADSNGQYPSGSLIQASDGLLYGLTTQGGAYNDGIIFSYTISTGVETALHNFNSNIDGVLPQGTLFQAGNGLLYGLTQGTPGGLFSYNISTGKDTLVYNMQLDSINQLTNDDAVIEVNDSLLYGETYQGGANNKGFIFEYNITTGKGADVDDFGAYGIGYPSGSLILALNGLLYGVSQEAGGGTLFVFNTATNTDSIIHSYVFQSVNGFDPLNSPTLASNGLLYGMTDKGGVYASGTAYNYNPVTGVYNIIANLNQFAISSRLLEVDSTTGINQLTFYKEQVTVYPNPSTGLVTITSSKNINNITVTNLVGQTILKSPLGDLFANGTNPSYGGGVTRVIDLSNFSAGMYFITITTGNETETGKIILDK